MGFKSPFDDPGISHGICLRCSREVIEAAKRKEKPFRRDSKQTSTKLLQEVLQNKTIGSSMAVT
jgi:hypothetical protein